jgi:aerobic carbon-monoxide dehydrogenase large subunit
VSILGNRVVRREDPRLITGAGEYVDDVLLDGALHVTYVRSTMAHARIPSIELDEAKAAPGVVAVITAADLDLEPTGPAMPFLNAQMPRPWLATDKVRYVGEPIVAVIAETRAHAADAAELVLVDYDPLPAVVDIETADGATLLFEDAGTNVALDFNAAFGFDNDPALFDGCDVVVRQRLVNQRVAPCPMEVRAVAARWDGGRLTFWASTQAPNTLRDDLAKHLGVGDAEVRVIAPDVGGGFGAKAAFYSEEHLVAWLSRRLGRPVRWTETRSESMLTLGHGRGQVQHLELGGTRDGKLLAYRLQVVADCGAYPAIGGFLPFFTRMLATGVYDIPKVEFGGKSVVTTTCPTVAYRGAGRPEATAAIERGVDLFAAEIGMDPAEVRRKNVVTSDKFPFTTPFGMATYDSGNYERALELMLEASDYAGLRAEQAARRERGDTMQLGLGVSMYVEITNPLPGGEYGAVEVTPDGGAIIKVGTFSHGQGHETTFPMIVADRLGIPLERIQYVQGDTDEVPRGQGTLGSRSLQTAGSALVDASTVVLDRAREVASELLEASVDDIVLDAPGGVFHVAGSPAISRTWTEVAAAAGDEGLKAEVDFMPQGPTFPFGAHLAVVDVDTETGKVELSRFIAVDDSGRILNPLITEGQRGGGIAQGVGQALVEAFVYDEDGNPRTGNLADYGMISACELPAYELVPMETPTPLNELGAKGIGESGTIGATPAVQNAVVDALAHLGVRHVDMPVTADRVWAAIQAAAAAG